MSYEYESGLGATGVTAYGTLPEAQEYVAEEFGLPYPVPASVVTPPISPRKPRSSITIFRPQDDLGVDDVCTGLSCWLEQNKPLVWAAGLTAGFLGMRWLLKRRERRMLENPSPRDIKLSETGKDGSIPMRRGKHKPLDPDNFDEPTSVGVNKFLEACYQLRPDLRERLDGLRKPTKPKRPRGASYPPYSWRKKKDLTPEKRESYELYNAYQKELRLFDEFVIPKYHRRKFELMILKTGRGWFTPEDWAGKKLFDRFHSFLMPCFVPSDYRKRRRGLRRVGHARPRTRGLSAKQRNALDQKRIAVAMTLWHGLGLPNGATVTARATDTVCRTLRVNTRLLNSTENTINYLLTRDVTPTILWQIISIPNFRQLNHADLDVLIETFGQTAGTEDAHRLRWWAERNIVDYLYAQADRSPDRSGSPPTVRRSHSVGWASREEKRFSKHPEFLRLSSKYPSIAARRRRPRRSLELPWTELPDVLKMNERSFIAEYAPSSGDAYAWLYSRVPKKTEMRLLAPPTIASIEMKQLLRAMKSPEISGMLQEALDEALTEQHLSSEEKAAQEEATIEETVEKLKAARKRVAEHKKKGKGLSASERGQWLGKLSQLKAKQKITARRLTGQRKYLRRLKAAATGPLENWAKWSIEREISPNMQHAAIALPIVFGPNWRNWLKKMERRGIDIHDATYWLPIESSPGLGEYLMQRWQSNISRLTTVARGWNNLSDEEKTFSPKEIVVVLEARVYSKATIPELAKEAARWGVDERDYYEIEDQWLKSLETKRSRPNTIPDYSGEYKGFKYYKMKDDDPRGLFLGQHTDCCQHVEHPVGYSCAWHGASSPDAAFYIVEDKDGTIVAQSWTWRNGRDIVFDSIEGYAMDDDRSKTIEELFVLLARRMVIDNKAERVLSGSQLRWYIEDPDRWSESVYSSDEYPPDERRAELPADYPKGGYSDAEHQYIVATKEKLDTIREDRREAESRKREQEAFDAADRGEEYWR